MKHSLLPIVLAYPHLVDDLELAQVLDASPCDVGCVCVLACGNHQWGRRSWEPRFDERLESVVHAKPSFENLPLA